MNKIKRSDIDFRKLKSVNLGNYSNSFYVDDNNEKIYKFYGNISSDKRKMTERKLEYFSDLDKDYISKVEDLIYDKELEGHSQKIIKGDTLYNLVRKKGLLEQMKNIVEVSKNLEDLHNSNAIMGDMHFCNIMINEDDKPIFIDQDSYGINGIRCFGVSVLVNNYFARKDKTVFVSRNSDRMGIYLSIFYKVFGREICSISNDTYISYCNTYPFLYELYPVYHELSKRNEKIPEVPYLHKVLKNCDYS